MTDFNKMTTVFHLGNESEKYIRRFHEKRVDMIIEKLRQYPSEELRSFRKSLSTEKNNTAKE